LERIDQKKQTPEERVLEKLKGILSPLKLLNPIKPEIPPGRSVGNLPASFGIQLIPESGIPEIKEEIDIILSYTLLDILVCPWKKKG
jgi:hypothetical protein